MRVFAGYDTVNCYTSWGAIDVGPFQFQSKLIQTPGFENFSRMPSFNIHFKAREKWWITC